MEIPAENLWLWMSADEIVEAARTYLDQGLMGVKLKVGNPDPEVDADKVTRVREALGEDIWLAVDANQRYDFGTALSMGHFFEEEIGADWFEEPIACDDVEGHARLVEKLEEGMDFLSALIDKAVLETETIEIVHGQLKKEATSHLF